MKKLLKLLFTKKRKESHYETLMHPPERKTIKPIYKISVFAGLLLLANVCSAQISLNMGSGYDFKADVPIGRIGLIMEQNKTVMSLKLNCPFSAKTNAPLYAGGSIGYDVKNFIPSIGFYNFYTSDGSKKVSKGVMSYSLSYNLIVNERGGLFFESNYIGNSLQLTTGFHVVF